MQRGGRGQLTVKSMFPPLCWVYGFMVRGQAGAEVGVVGRWLS